MPASRKKSPVLTVFAGPNGSGKSTLAARLLSDASLGILVNADQIAVSLAGRKGEDIPSPGTQREAAISAEEMRWTLLSQGVTFSTETVMSDKSRWLEFIASAKLKGYWIVMYFVTTSDPSVNIERVAERVTAGGHAVDPGKIVTRYRRVMNDVLPEVLQLVDEAILFDNSDPELGLVGVLLLREKRLSALIEESQLPEWAKLCLTSFSSIT